MSVVYFVFDKHVKVYFGNCNILFGPMWALSMDYQPYLVFDSL